MARDKLFYKDVTISSGASLSTVIPLVGYLVVGVIMPAAWTAATLTFQATRDDAAFFDVYSDTAEKSMTAAGANRHIIVLPEDFAGMHTIRLRSGTSAAPVNQAANRTITLVLREA